MHACSVVDDCQLPTACVTPFAKSLIYALGKQTATHTIYPINRNKVNIDAEKGETMHRNISLLSVLYTKENRTLFRIVYSVFGACSPYMHSICAFVAKAAVRQDLYIRESKQFYRWHRIVLYRIYMCAIRVCDRTMNERTE